MWRTASVLVGVVLILTTIGIIMLASTSGVHGVQQFGDPNYFVKRQAVSILVALIIGFLSSRLDYQWWNAIAVPLTIVTVILLILPLVPGIGVTVKGSSRWIRLGFMNFQPSELGKLGAIVLLSWYMAKSQRRARDLVDGLMVPLGLLGLIGGLIFIAPDFGTTMLVVGVGILLLFAGGTRVSYLIVTAVLGASAFVVAIMHSPVRMRRITAFLNPEKYAEHEAYQLLGALYAFVIGGPRGVGLGQSMQKRYYLPESHTDFIFAIIGEELGFIASLSIVLLFAVFFVAGMRIALRAPDQFSRLLALGITLMIAVQAAANIAVVTGVVPTKGLPLPFISYGGSSILVTMMMVGILVNVALQADELEED